jgi:N4-gp56 family major capsid protein
MAGNVWAVNSLGGFMYQDNLSEEFRESLQPEVKFRQFADLQSAYGKNRGENFHWNVYLNIQSQGGTLVETNTMPESNFRVIQGTLTVNEYGNSIPYTDKLESLAKESVRKPVIRALKNDAKKAFDFAAHTQFNNTLLRVVPAAAGTSTSTLTLTTNGTATATNNIAYQKEHAKLVYDLMKERNIPAYTSDDYMAIAWPSTLRRLKNDLESIKQYTTEGFGMIMNGEMGRYEKTRYIEQTNIAKGHTPVSGGVTATAWASGNDWIYFFGEDTVMEGVAVAEEIRAKMPGDYGRSKGIAWYYLGGFGIVHANSSFTDQGRIIKWDSAA